MFTRATRSDPPRADGMPGPALREPPADRRGGTGLPATLNRNTSLQGNRARPGGTGGTPGRTVPPRGNPQNTPRAPEQVPRPADARAGFPPSTPKSDHPLPRNYDSETSEDEDRPIFNWEIQIPKNEELWWSSLNPGPAIRFSPDQKKVIDSAVSSYNNIFFTGQAGRPPCELNTLGGYELTFMYCI